MSLLRRGERLVSSPRSLVWAGTLDGRPVVVKRIVGPGAAARFARERAALELAGAAPRPVVPDLLAADPGTCELVLERVAHHPLGPGWRVAYATALAHLAASASASGRDGHGAGGSLPGWRGPGVGDVQAFLRLADALGVGVTAADARQVAELPERLARLGTDTGTTGLVHGDPCPGNDLHTAAGVRFVDLEQAAIGSGLVDLAYLRVGFPTCWGVTRASEAALAEAEAAWARTWWELTGADVRPVLTGTLTVVGLGWLIRGDTLVELAHRDGTDHFARLLADDWEWGTATARERLVFRLGAVAAADDLPARMLRAARRRWPGLRAVPEVRGSV